MAPAERVQIPGSEREFTAEHERVRDVAAEKLIDVTVYLRPRATLDWIDDAARRLPADRRSVTREGSPRVMERARRTSRPWLRSPATTPSAARSSQR
jgi:hypothetical protein